MLNLQIEYIIVNLTITISKFHDKKPNFIFEKQIYETIMISFIESIIFILKLKIRRFMMKNI